jgi:tRNA threonylcarbamoyladenosine biosynthesis protein TsaE
MTAENVSESILSVSEEHAVECASNGPDETAALGERIGAILEPGDVLLLQGELGAGKTCLTQGVARGLGIAGPVCSPTFVLVGEYEGRLHLYHADLYRLENPLEVADLDLDRSSESGVLIVEWPERAPEWLPREHLLVKFEHAGPSARRIRFEAHGGRPATLLRQIADRLGSAASTNGH